MESFFCGPFSKVIWALSTVNNGSRAVPNAVYRIYMYSIKQMQSTKDRINQMPSTEDSIIQPLSTEYSPKASTEDSINQILSTKRINQMVSYTEDTII